MFVSIFGGKLLTKIAPRFNNLRAIFAEIDILGPGVKWLYVSSGHWPEPIQRNYSLFFLSREFMVQMSIMVINSMVVMVLGSLDFWWLTRGTCFRLVCLLLLMLVVMRVSTAREGCGKIANGCGIAWYEELSEGVLFQNKWGEGCRNLIDEWFFLLA